MREEIHNTKQSSLKFGRKREQAFYEKLYQNGQSICTHTVYSISHEKKMKVRLQCTTMYLSELLKLKKT